MKLINVTSQMNKDKWNVLIEDYPLKTIYHQWEWLEFIRKSQKLNLIIYEIIDDDLIVGYFPGFLVFKGPLKILASPIPGWTTPYLGPLLDKDFPQERFFSEFKNLMRKEKYHFAEITNINLDGEAARNSGLIVSERITYVSEIAPTSEQILNKFRKSTKFAVRKIIR